MIILYFICLREKSSRQWLKTDIRYFYKCTTCLAIYKRVGVSISELGSGKTHTAAEILICSHWFYCLHLDSTKISGGGNSVHEEPRVSVARWPCLVSYPHSFWQHRNYIREERRFLLSGIPSFSFLTISQFIGKETKIQYISANKT